ncbi:conjugal transfer protein TraG N-terminal domain-containing protein [Noviherbaspirillum autotrophicum]|uniref:Conjugal transfer protein TraG n=1 Tax=Noviherbaspirillum autotrophicum TaxID=709839 RepID=A0A0C1Y3D4_9BURK|nr:conjugal transfer protein TraG N-terminal domain-containing protein [Noviherbaspirillum autotrophicum]KIF81613.1 conjugal transfer protein TraG [Noviherbaspirillum autotrophicum]
MWEIFAYQNSDGLFGIFNAIAAIRGSDTYLSAMAGVAFCGFIAALLAYAFAPQKLQGWQWLATVVLVYSVLFVPRVTVGIVDKTGGAPVKIIDNVPFGLAMFGGITSTVGTTITELFETAFQVIPGNANLPSELTYQKNGLLFGNRLIRETGSVVFQDPNFRTDLINFIHNCTMFDLIDGTIDPTTFSRSDDVWSLMGNPNPARFTTLTSVGGSVSTDTCPNAYNALSARIPAQVSLIQGKLAFQLNPTLPAAAASSVIANQIQQAYIRNHIANAAASAADIIRQNAMLNAINDTGKIIGQKINDPASIILAVGQAQAVAQTNAAWINNGKIAEQALPVVRNVVEALAYALFPLVVLLLFLTSGRETMMALKNYLGVLIWIQLWPPLYAILNYMASIYAASELSAAADIGSGAKALSLLTASPIFANAISSQAVVGYLTISIPVIAWAAIKRMENLGNALVGGLSGLQSTTSSTSGSAANGNVNMGNVSMDQMQLAPNRTSAFMSSAQSDITGNTLSTNALTGVSAINMLRNQGFASRTVSVKVGEQEVAEANKSADAARSEAIAANTERSTILADIFSKGTTKLGSHRSSSGSSRSSYEEIGNSLDHLNQITNQVASKTGLTQQQVAQIAFGAAGHFGFGTNSPILNAGAEVRASAGKNYSAGISAEEQKVLSYLTQDQMAEFKKFGDRLSRDTSVLNALSRDNSEASELSSRLATTTNRAQRTEAKYAERVAFAERLSSAREKGETISIDIAADPHNIEMFRRYAEQYGGTSASAHALLDSELARQAPRPNRVFSDGTAVPVSFGDASKQHDSYSAAPNLKPNIDTINMKNRSAVKAHGPAISAPEQAASAPNPELKTVRKDIQEGGKVLTDKTSSAPKEFDKETEITKTENGTLATRKSLLLNAASQGGRDASNTFENAKEIVQKVLQDK